jgi:pimeloyl-ACP methyl ester carboxylesterase
VSQPAGALLVHGLWHGSWAWDPVRERLSAAAVPSVAVDLPMRDLAGDVAVVRTALDEFARPAVLVGHSYGGAVITDAGTHPLVRELLYVAAFQLDTGESVGRTLPDLPMPQTRLGEALRFDDESDEVRVDPQLGAEVFYRDAPADLMAAALAQLRPVHRPVFRGVPEQIAWRGLPSTYVVCTDDEAVHPDLERAMARRATRTVELAAGHTPLLTAPDAVAELIIDAVIRVRG